MNTLTVQLQVVCRRTAMLSAVISQCESQGRPVSDHSGVTFAGRIQSIQFVSPVFKACIIHSECSSQQSSGESSDSNDNWHEAEATLTLPGRVSRRHAPMPLCFIFYVVKVQGRTASRTDWAVALKKTTLM
ncbi:hypothetical protein F2P81_006796 [Scophthalmus maximus]|uniref:Uncharacterized protein n=1 Tax=Scophthalmus maximus TaxID=52904 RepID=A0A6A4T951_SCOMX|nr:hypothetical protein F2P81_006796 [Scophthalmus maximus]